MENIAEHESFLSCVLKIYVGNSCNLFISRQVAPELGLFKTQYKTVRMYYSNKV